MTIKPTKHLWLYILSSISIAFVLTSCESKPTCDLVADKTTVYAGETVSFTDKSKGGNGKNSNHWTFAGGTPATIDNYTFANVQYNTPGVYDVSIYVWDSDNDNCTKTIPGYITVLPAPDASCTWCGQDICADKTVDDYIGGTLNGTHTSTMTMAGDTSQITITNFANIGSTYTIVVHGTNADSMYANCFLDDPAWNTLAGHTMVFVSMEVTTHPVSSTPCVKIVCNIDATDHMLYYY